MHGGSGFQPRITQWHHPAAVYRGWRPLNKAGLLSLTKSVVVVFISNSSDATTLEVHEILYLLTRVKVKDIMTRNVITVLPDFTVEETAQVLQKNRISGATVVDANGQLVGTILGPGKRSQKHFDGQADKVVGSSTKSIPEPSAKRWHPH